MKNITMFCLTLNPNHLNKIKKLNYRPVGLGAKNFSSEWITDKSRNNISKKNPFYGEYTFHYSIWKQEHQNIKTDWVGFCQYRKFWSLSNVEKKINNLEDLNQRALNKIPAQLESFESILGEPFYVNQFRFKKFIKRNFITMLKDPSLFFFKSRRNIRFHFDMWHGKGNLDKAINLLDENEKNDFKIFVDQNVSFNPHNMIICKKEFLLRYYDSVFPWLEKCEKIFGFPNTDVYGLKRIYGFLAERYISYWFKKYSSHTTLPIFFKDLTNLN